jgi:N6-L-threonylcarbamoyladenine synthase
MLILGLETSCDETSAAVVEDGRVVRSSVIWSQVAAHAPYGGVVPEIASRRHIQVITRVARQALQEAGVGRAADLGAVAATYGPGLAGALLVGLNFGRGMALCLGVPFVPVNHLDGHLHSVWLRLGPDGGSEPELPMLALIVSGGHTELVLMRDHGDYVLVGRTRDDAAGEAFDKVARVLGMSYPGGPAIQVEAALAQDPVPLPRARLPGTFDFSFSGLKTAVLHRAHELASGRPMTELRGVSLPRVDVAESLSPEQRTNLAAGFQESVVDVLVSKTVQAADHFGACSVAVVGGVAANRRLRERMREMISLPLRISAPDLSTDNAAMIAAAAWFVPKQDDGVDVEPGLRLATRQVAQG